MTYFWSKLLLYTIYTHLCSDLSQSTKYRRTDELTRPFFFFIDDVAPELRHTSGALFLTIYPIWVFTLSP